jgi:hypothetical protein
MGTTVPSAIAEHTVSADPRPTTTQPSAYIPAAVLTYLDAAPGDRLAFNKLDDGRVEISREAADE